MNKWMTFSLAALSVSTAFSEMKGGKSEEMNLDLLNPSQGEATELVGSKLKDRMMPETVAKIGVEATQLVAGKLKDRMASQVVKA